MILATCRSVLMRKLTHTAESQERAEAESCGRMGIFQCIADEDTVLIMLEHHFFFEDYTTHTIEGGWNFVTVKLSDVLVTFRAEIVALILVEAKIELCSVLDDRHIKRRKQHVILVIQFRNGYDKQSMILARVTVNNRGT